MKKLGGSTTDTLEVTEKVARTEKKVKEAKYIPTVEECWEEIMSSPKLSASKRKQYSEVRQAMAEGILGRAPSKPGGKVGKFSKAEADRLYKHLQVLKRDDILKELVEKTPENYILVTDLEGLTEMRRTVEVQSEIGYDTETTGLDKYKDKIVGHCVYCPDDDKSFYLPFRHTTGEVQIHELEVDNAMRHMLSKVPVKILHNAQYDMHMCINDNLPITGTWHCTQTIAHVFNENELSYQLKELVPKYLGIPSDKYDSLFGDGGFEGVPLKYARYYGANDPKITYQLFKFYEGIALAEGDPYDMKASWDSYIEEELPLIKNVVDIERTGAVINLDHMGAMSLSYEEAVNALEKEILEAIGEINLGSPDQLKSALSKYTGEKFTTTEKKFLKTKRAQFPIIGKLLEWRQMNKLKNDFMDKLPDFRVDSTGRFHFNLKPRGTKTARFSSQKYNIQQIHKIIRQAFEAPEGMLLLSADFGGQENRILGHLCQDENMIEGWKTGKDFYSMVASSAFEVPYEECGDGTKWRNAAKVIVLAVTYGISEVELGFSNLPLYYEHHGIKKEVTKKDAIEFGKKLVRLFLDGFPRIEPWMKETRKMAHSKGVVYTMFGTKARLPRPKALYVEKDKHITEVDRARRSGWDIEANTKVSGKKTEVLLPWQFLPQWKQKSALGSIDRKAINYVIQKSAAQQTKRVMNEFAKWAEHKRKQGREFYISMQIHDELIFWVPEDIVEEELRMIEKIMTQTVQLHNIEVVTDIAIGKNWRDMIPEEEFKSKQEEYVKLWRQKNWMKK